MRLGLELKRIVNNTIVEEKVTSSLREEITRVLGPTIIVEGDLNEIASNANDRIEVLECTGRSGAVRFKTTLLLKLANSKSVEARKLAARLLPTNLIERFLDDKNSGVRLFAARRLPRNLIKEAAKRHPGDDGIISVLREAPVPKEQDQHLHIHDEKRIGDLAKSPTRELSKQWYETTANKLIQDYGGNLERQWEELAVHRFCSSTKATSGVVVDEKKLLDVVLRKLKEKDDEHIERTDLKETVMRLRVEALHEFEGEQFDESVDPVTVVLNSNFSPRDIVNNLNSLLKIEHTVVNSAVKRFLVSEGALSETRVPHCATMPSGLRQETFEIALDAYVKAWNSTHRQTVLEWNYNTTGASFSTRTK